MQLARLRLSRPSWSSLIRYPTVRRPLDERLRVAKILWAKDSPQYTRMQEGRGYRNMMNTSMHNNAEVIDRQGAWRQIRQPELKDSAALRMENEALKAELAALKAKGGVLTKL